MTKEAAHVTNEAAQVTEAEVGAQDFVPLRSNGERIAAKDETVLGDGEGRTVIFW